MSRTPARFLLAVFAGACGSRTQLDRGTAEDCGEAASFSAFGDDVFLPGLNATPKTGFTWDFWFKAAKLPTSPAIDLHAGATLVVAADGVGCEDVYVGFGADSIPANVLAFNVDGGGGCAARDASPITYVPPAPFATGTWYFVAVSHDYASGASRLYIDGQLVASKSGSTVPIPRALPVTVGRWTDRAQFQYNQLDGAIDELHVLGRALTDAEIAAEYNGGAGRYGQPGPDLIAGYHFDETAEAYAGPTGTLEHGAGWETGWICAPR